MIYIYLVNMLSAYLKEIWNPESYKWNVFMWSGHSLKMGSFAEKLKKIFRWLTVNLQKLF